MPQSAEYLHVQINGEQVAIQGSVARPAVTSGYVFEIHHKLLSFSTATIKQWWLDRRTVFPTKGRRPSNYREILRYGLARAEQLPGGPVDKSVDHIGLAALMPHIRDIGANRIVTDAALHPAQLDNVIADLETLLQQSSIATTTVDQFISTAHGLIGPSEEMRQRLGTPYYEMSKQLIELIRQDICNRDLDLPSAVKCWGSWKKRFIRPDRHRSEIDAMDAISLEARASLLQVYSGLWNDLLHGLSAVFNPPFLRFHRLWHCEWRWDEDGQTKHLFQGHCVGLHPAGSLLIQTPTGRSFIEPLLMSDEDDPAFFRFLHGLSCALHVYASARETYKEDRRHLHERKQAMAVADADSRRRGRRRRHRP